MLVYQRVNRQNESTRVWQVYFSVLQRHAARYETGGRQLNGDLSMGQNPGTLVFTLK